MNKAAEMQQGEQESKAAEPAAPAKAADPAAPKKRRTSSEARAAVADLLNKGEPAAKPGKVNAGETPGAGIAESHAPATSEPGDPGVASGSSAPAPAPKTWREVAERVGLTPEALYALQVDLAQDKGHMTLGQVKDAMQMYGDALPEASELIRKAREDRAAASQERDFTNADAATVRRDIMAVIGAMGKLPAGVMEAMAPAMKVRAEQQSRLLDIGAPEWKDPEVKRRDQAEIVESLTRYGYTQEEARFIDDSRFWLRERDQLRARREARAAIEKPGENPGGQLTRNATPTGRGAQSAYTAQQQRARIAASANGGHASRISAVAALLSGRR